MKCNECLLCFPYIISFKSHSSLWGEPPITPRSVYMTCSKSPRRKVERSASRLGPLAPLPPRPACIVSLTASSLATEK